MRIELWMMDGDGDGDGDGEKMAEDFIDGDD